MKQLYAKISNLLLYMKLFSNIFDAMKYRLIKNEKIQDDKIRSVHVREAGGNPLLIRPLTTDAQVLWDTFYCKYHLPPLKLNKNSVIVDLGAYVGYTMVHFAYLYPKSRIIGVEMDRANYEIALKNIQFFTPRCELLHAAVWTSNGQIEYVGKMEWGFRVSREINKNINGIKSAPAITIDSIFEKYQLKTINYLKIDIEGAEATVLRGPIGWMQKVEAIKIEIHPPATIDQCQKILISNGFTCKKDNYHPRCLIALK